MKKQSRLTYLVITFLFLTFSNFYFSNYIAQNVANNEITSMPLVNIIFVKNTGAAFSILQNSTNFLIGLSIFAIIGIFYYVIRNLETIFMKEIFFICFLASGIFCNLYERIAFGYVRDFFDLTFMNFPVFNISDIYINIGVLGIIVLLLLTKKPIKLL